MLELTIDRFGYLTIDTEEWLNDFSEVSETWTNVFRAYAGMRAQSYSDSYVSAELVRDWAESLGTVSGIYGEDGPVTVSTCNMDSFLENDVTYSFLHIEAIRADEEWQHTLIVVHGSGYMASSAEWCEVREFNGYDDGEAFGFASGYALHDSGREGCADWIIESACVLWPNGGSESYRVAEHITEDAETGQGILSCPLCGDTLTPYAN